MSEEASQITIIADLLKRDPSYKEVVDQLEERLYGRYMVYLSDKPKFNAKTQAIPKQYLAPILSFKNTLELNKVAKKYNLTQEQRDIVPEILWKIFHKEAEIKNLPQMINSELNTNNIRNAYLIAVDIANIYLSISDYLGDIPMVIKRWQYEMPTGGESTISQIIQPKITAGQISQKPQETAPSPTIQVTQVAPPPIRQPEILQQKPIEAPVIPPSQPIMPLTKPQIDESIPKVQETLARLSQKSIQEPPQIIKPAEPTPQPHQEPTQQKTPPPPLTGKSDFEPEYLPDEPTKPVSKGNIIDLKNF